MADLFKNKTTFNQDISTWDTSAVTHMGGMFNGATAFNQDIGTWNTASVTDMAYMFLSATAFNKDISTWNTAAVTDMRWMFWGATAFNQDVSAWDTSLVTDMRWMFRDASSFDNGGVALDWSDTSKVTNMSLMFRDATAFNQNIDNWNVSSVIDMNAMFWSATAFNQNIGNWNVSSVTTMNDMFKNVTLSTANYDLLLQGFNELELQDNINFDGGNSKYSAGEIAMYRANIISTDSWTITDGGIGDSTSPILSSASPADGATGVAVDANIVLTFSEAVDVESGNITIKKSSDDSTVETIDVTSGLVSGTGTTTITINPATTLTSSTGYYLNIAAAAFDDTAGNSYLGITDATTLNFTTVVNNLPSPLDKKDVIGSIEAWSDISSSWANSNIESALGRIDWLNRHKGSNQTSYQGIKLNFVDTLINKIMNNSPSKALSDIDVVNTSATLINNSDGTLAEVSDNVEAELSSIAINEAVIIREGLIGSLNPSFGPVLGSWSVWTEGEVIIGNTDASTTASKKKASAQAISFGFDRPIRSGDELMGFVFSAGQSDTDIGTASTSVKSNNYSLLSYSVFKTKGAQLESVFGLGRLDFDTTRTDGSDTLTGARKANQLLLSSTIRPQNTINLGNWHLSPYTKASLANTRLNSFSESGAATALTFNKQQVRDTELGVGFDINTLIKDRGNTIQPFAKIEYARSSSKTSASMHYNDEDASLYTYTTSLNKSSNNWKMKLGLDLNTESGWNTSVSYTREQSIGSSANSQNSNSFSFNAGIKF